MRAVQDTRRNLLDKTRIHTRLGCDLREDTLRFVRAYIHAYTLTRYDGITHYAG